MDEKAQARAEILDAARRYFAIAFPPSRFDPEKSPVPVSGKVLDADDLTALVDSSLDMWLTTGRFAEEFEKQIARRIGTRFAKVVNSGSSANLTAVSSLTAVELGDRRLRPGDEVITAAAGFPTTVNPIVQNGLVPVFVDSVLGTYDVDAAVVEQAIGPRTRAIILAHTLGNPFAAHKMRDIADRHGLWLIEDCCDAFGATVGGRNAGTYGDLATLSFYPAHHITTGEGGAVLSGARFEKIIESFRDWGRACWCAPGCENTCGKRFEWELGSLPYGYDHKYIYTRLGYNLKMTDMQAAVGLSQLSKLDGFIERRRKNWSYLREALSPYEGELILPEPAPESEPSWFGFPITIRQDGTTRRNELIAHLESRRIATRLLFGGNIVRQPAYSEVTFRIHESLPVADKIMHDTFWIGVFPGLTEAHLAHAVVAFADFFKHRVSQPAVTPASK